MNHTYLNQHRKGFEPDWKPVVWIDWRKTICTNMRTSRSIKCSQWRSGLRTFPLQLSVTWLDVVRRGLVPLFISWQMSQTINCHDVHNSDTSVFQKICTWKNKCVYSRVQKSKITLRTWYFACCQKPRQRLSIRLTSGLWLDHSCFDPLTWTFQHALGSPTNRISVWALDLFSCFRVTLGLFGASLTKSLLTSSLSFGGWPPHGHITLFVC